MTQRIMPSALLACVLLGAAASCGRDAPVAVLHGSNGPVRVRIEIVSTPAARSKGLMYRTSLADDQGMLFVFDETSDHGFWMKNTFIPLDMIFIDESLAVVGVHENAVPQSTRNVSIGRPSRYVLEVPGGWSARHGISAGARVELPGVARG